MTQPTTLRMSSPGEFIAAVPVLLGFYPVDSLVVALLERRPPADEVCVKVVARHDLHTSDSRLTAVVTQLAGVAANENASAVLALVVDSAAQPASAPHHRHTHALDNLDRALTARGVVLASAWATRVIEAGAPWWSLPDATESGVVPDPDASALAATVVVAGHPIRRSREELTRLIEPDPALADQVRALLPADTDLRTQCASSEIAADVATVVAHIDTLAAGARLTPADMAALAVALRTASVRHCMLGLAGTARLDMAERLWALLSRSLPDPERAHAAALLAFSAYHRGDGVLASIALDAALASDPQHRFARSLDAALRDGTSPPRLGAVVTYAHDIADALGVDLHRCPASPLFSSPRFVPDQKGHCSCRPRTLSRPCPARNSIDSNTVAPRARPPSSPRWIPPSPTAGAASTPGGGAATGPTATTSTACCACTRSTSPAPRARQPPEPHPIPVHSPDRRGHTVIQLVGPRRSSSPRRPL